MKIRADIVGMQAGPAAATVDRRWLMAYNAALGEVSAAPHPLFPVCYEWDAFRALRVSTGLQELNARLVHAQHDLTIHRPVGEGTLAVRSRVVAVAQRRPGTLVTIRLTAETERGEPVSTTDYGMLYRGVPLEGGERSLVELADPPKVEAKLEPVGEVPVAATAGHVYTECARIWNPIHTDPEYAREAGLPGIILHGTATLALSLSRVMASFGRQAKRVRCRFSGMVLMPNTLAVHAAREGGEVVFETRNAAGETVIERGRLLLE